MASSTKSEILELAEKPAKELKAQLIEKNLLTPSSTFCQALGLTRQSLVKAIAENRMFYLKHGRRNYYPAFYVDGQVPRLVLEDVTQALGDLGGPQKWQFFTRPKGSLSGKTPLEALRDGLVERVLIAARGFSSR